MGFFGPKIFCLINRINWLFKAYTSDRVKSTDLARHDSYTDAVEHNAMFVLLHRMATRECTLIWLRLPSLSTVFIIEIDLQ